MFIDYQKIREETLSSLGVGPQSPQQHHTSTTLPKHNDPITKAIEELYEDLELTPMEKTDL